MQAIKMAGIALAFCAFQAHAAPVIETQVSLTNLNYTVTDLRPYDLYAPKLTLVSNQDGTYVSATDLYTRTGESIVVPGNLFGSESGQSQTYDGVGHATKTGRDQTATITLDQSSFENAPGVFYFPATYMNRLGASAGTGGSSNWTLSPYTRLTISGTLSLEQTVNGQALVSLAGLQEASDRIITLSTTSQASLGIYKVEGLYNTTLDSTYLRVTSGQVVNSAGVADLAQGREAHLTKSFTLTVENNSAQALLLSIDGGVHSSASGTLTDSLIPEPGTWALMALGLGLMAWRVRAARPRVSSNI